MTSRTTAEDGWNDSAAGGCDPRAGQEEDATLNVSEMVVFPTLVEDQVNVRIRAEEAIDGLIWVSDAFGRRMVQRRIALPAQSLNLETIELGNLPAGNYFLSIMNNGKIATRRFMRK